MKLDVLTIDNKKSSVLELNKEVFRQILGLIFCIEWLLGS